MATTGTMKGAIVRTVKKDIQKTWNGSARRNRPLKSRAGEEALHMPLWRWMQSSTVVHSSVVISQSCPKGSRCPQNSQQHGLLEKSMSVSSLYSPQVANGRIPCQKGLPYLSCNPRLQGCTLMSFQSGKPESAELNGDSGSASQTGWSENRRNK